MAITIDETQYIAHLARLGIGDKDLNKYTQNLSDILDYVAQLSKIDTRNITPMAHPLSLTQRLRPDEITETSQHLQFQQIAPAVEAGLYLVPKVIEENA